MIFKNLEYHVILEDHSLQQMLILTMINLFNGNLTILNLKIKLFLVKDPLFTLLKMVKCVLIMIEKKEKEARQGEERINTTIDKVERAKEEHDEVFRKQLLLLLLSR